MATSDILMAINFAGAKIWYVWFAFMILFLIAFYYFFTFYINMRKYAPESTIEMQCSKPLKKRVEGRIIDTSLFEIPVVVNPHKDNPALIDDNHAFVSPNLVSSAKLGRKGNGTNTLNYMVGSAIPIDFRSAAALQQLLELVRDKHPKLGWMTESFDVLACIFSPTNYTYEDCKQTVVDNIRYGNIEEGDRDDKTQELYDEILEIRKEMNITRLKSGIVNLGEAAEISNIGVTNRMVQEIIVEQRRVDAMGIIDDFFAKNVKYLTLMAGFAAVVLIFMMVLNYLK